jgi:hypothetical protein
VEVILRNVSTLQNHSGGTFAGDQAWEKNMSASFRKGYLGGDFLTPTYRISGEVDLRGDPLLDQLNNHMELYLQLERVFISPLLEPATLTGNFAQGSIRKSSIGLTVLKDLRDGLPRREGQYMGRDHVDRKIFVVACGFEVRGNIRLHPSVNVTNFVRTTPEQFIPLLDASATLSAQREVVFRGGAILLNRNQIEVFCVVEK